VRSTASRVDSSSGLSATMIPPNDCPPRPAMPGPGPLIVRILLPLPSCAGHACVLRDSRQPCRRFPTGIPLLCRCCSRCGKRGAASGKGWPGSTPLWPTSTRNIPGWRPRCMSSRAGGCRRAWVIAMRCRAALSCRFPVRDSRCRCLFDDQTGRGAVPLCRAKASLERNRCTRAVSPTILAAVNGPQPRWPTAMGQRS
jgi:hypothetical protein